MLGGSVSATAIGNDEADDIGAIGFQGARPRVGLVAELFHGSHDFPLSIRSDTAATAHHVGHSGL